MQTDRATCSSPVPGSVSAWRLRRSIFYGLALYLTIMAICALWLGFPHPCDTHTDASSEQIQRWKSVTFVVVVTGIFALFLLRSINRWVHRQAAQALKADDYRQIFDGNAAPILIYDTQTFAILDANPAALACFGWSRDELTALTLDRLWSKGMHGKLGEIIGHVREDSARAVTVTDHLLLRDGSMRLMEIRENPIRYSGRMARMITANDRSTDVLAQKRQNQMLARLEEAHAIARIGSWELDPATGLGLFSDQAYALLGRKAPAQQRWLRLQDLLVASNPDIHADIEFMLSELCGGRTLQLDVLLPLIAMDGRALTIHLRAKTSCDVEGRPLNIQGTLQDVTEHEQSRRLLSEREEQFRELVRLLPDGVIILSGDEVLYVNSTGATQFGDSAERLVGESLESLVDAADLVRIRNYLRLPQRQRDAITTPAPHMRRRDGTHFRAALSVGDVRYSSRDCTLLIIRDLTEPVRNREALQTSNRELQAMAGRLFSLQEDERRAISRDLHDDIGQAITAMKLSAYAAMEENDPQRRRDDLQQITSLADTTIAKLRNLSMLLRPPQLDALGLEAALRWQAGMLFRSSAVELVSEIEALPQRPANKIEQACFRIAQESLTNALRHANASQVKLLLDDDEEGQLRLQIIDDGEGFDPSGPRGLGLIVMRERAQAAGGNLQIRSAPGDGTHVELRLPYRIVDQGTHEIAGH